ncbi:MAG: hypothetical protein B0A82_08320 [Alkalinema sp. CACIAM 70d]|nr:MAG: hypothetical protein B0A82_08320 [Alkalinema sp. CACIAM 70d]
MMKRFIWLPILSVLYSCFSLGLTSSVKAQSITPTIDGTGTQVIQSGGTYTIQGGAVSSDRANLFHQFERFGLNANEIANFLANPQTRNIFGLVTGGNPSIINGLIQVTGSNSPNLFLSNPAGIVFGANASLNIPGSFTATTANGIGFGDQWLNVIGRNDYAALVGNPTGFTFTMAQPGAIGNAGTLSVLPGQSVRLVGGTVLNTGTIVAPGGNITIAAVPGSNRVRISQEGRLLSLELAADQGTSGVQPLPFVPKMLPDLLTIGRVPSSDIPVPTEGGTAIVSGQLSVATNQATTQTPQINVLGKNVGLVNAQLDASGESGGGTIRVGGDYQGKGTIPNATQTFVSPDSVLHADALTSGNGGKIIVWADKATQFYGTATARGATLTPDPLTLVVPSNGGFVEISGKDNLAFQGKVDTSAPNGKMGTLLLDPTNITVVAAGGTANTLADVTNIFAPDLGSGASTTIDAALLNATQADVILQATNDITFSAPVNITTIGIGLTAQARNSIFVNAGITTQGGSITLTADADNTGGGNLNITNATLTTNGGNFTGIGRGNSTVARGIDISNSNINVESGNILLTGVGGTTINNNYGVAIGGVGIVKATGTGSITIDGTAGIGTGNPSESDVGVAIGGNPTAVSTEAGAINITGQGGISTGARNHGIQISASNTAERASISSTTGLINLSGKGGGASTSRENYGISLLGGTGLAIGSIDGTIKLTGTGGTGTGDANIGIRFYSGASITSTGRGNITLDGTAGSNIASNYGIVLGLEAGASIRAADGNIQLTGKRGVDGGGGVFIFNGSTAGNGSVVESTNGDIFIEGTGQINTGVIIGDSRTNTPGGSQIRATNGNLSIVGSTAGNAAGISINDGTLEATKGNLSLVGTSTAGIGLFLSDRTFINPSEPGTGTLSINAPQTRLGNLSQIQAGNLNLSRTNLIGITSDINLIAPQGINIGNVTNPGRAITLISQGNIFTGILDTSSNTSNAGDITLNAVGNITATSLLARATTLAPNSNIGNGGNITVNASGNITTGLISTISSTIIQGNSSDTAVAGSAGNGGTVTLRSTNGSITNADLISTWSQSNVSGDAGNAGNVTLAASRDIYIGRLEAFSSAISGNAAKGGNLEANTTTGNITTGYLQAFSQASNGTAGNGGTIQLNADPVNGAINIFPQGNATAVVQTYSLASGAVGTGGNIALTAGKILASTGSLQAYATSGGSNGVNQIGGAVTLTASKNITPTIISTTKNNITLNGPVTLFDSPRTVIGFNNTPITLSISIPGTLQSLEGNVFVNGTVNGKETLTLNTGRTAGRVSLNGLVGGTTPLTNLAITTPDLQISGGVILDNGQPQVYSIPVTLVGNAIFGSTRTPSVTFNDILAVGSNTLTIKAQNFNFANAVTGTGTLQLYPAISGQNMEIAGANLTVTSLSALQSGFQNIVIGDRTGSITLGGNATFNSPVTLQANTIDTTGGTLFGTGSATLTLFANQDITTGDIINPGRSITLNASNGTLTTGNLNSSATTGGNVDLRARLAITTQVIDTSGTVGNGGNVLIDPIGDVQVTSINTQGGINGTGGSVDITAGQFFRATGTFLDRNNTLASISTAGGQGGGNIILRHGTGTLGFPFIIGDSARSGTAGAITSGQFRLEPQQRLFGSFTLGNIQLITTDPQSPPEKRPTPVPLPEPKPHPEVQYFPVLDPGVYEGPKGGIDQQLAVPIQYFYQVPVPLAFNSSKPSNPSSTSLSNQPDSNKDSRGIPAPSAIPSSEVGAVPRSVSIDRSSPNPQPNLAPQSNPASQPNPDNIQQSSVSPGGYSSTTSLVIPKTADSTSVSSQTITPSNSPDETVSVSDSDPSSEKSSTSDGQNSSSQNTNTSVQSGVDKNINSQNSSIQKTDVQNTNDVPTIEKPKQWPLAEVRDQLAQIERATGLRPALIYAVFARTVSSTAPSDPPTKSAKSSILWKFNAPATSLPLSEAVALAQADPHDDDRLELILVTANGSVVRKPVILNDTHKAVTREEMLGQVDKDGQALKEGQVDLLYQMSWEKPKKDEEFKQRKYAQNLYKVLVQPLEEELKNRGISNLVFLMDQGLRRIPLAALHDGKQYLVEKYSLGLSPSLSLTDTRYADPRKAQLLAMGRSDFSDELSYRGHNLIGTTSEINQILQIWKGSKPFLNRDFTQKNLLNERRSQQYGIIHLATHAKFDEDLQQSHIQLWGSRLTLNDIGTLRWYEPSVELVVLSACQTAKDSKDAELGFAGFAVRSGAKSALASLWSVNDAGTVPLMIQFYQQLHSAKTPIKAEALRQAQIAMIQGKLKIENGQLVGLGQSIPLLNKDQNITNLSHPYYWAGFTLIGSPW